MTMAAEVCMGYVLDRPFTNEGAGYSLWCFGTKNSKPYFIKQFLSPKFPMATSDLTPKQREKYSRKCRDFIEKKKAVYTALNTGSDGNDVRVRDFFRVGSRFYIAMDKVDSLEWTIEDVRRQSEGEKRRLCAVIAHAIWGLHRNKLVHADLKHENILYTRTPAGAVTAKVIDFDNSYLESDPPGPDDIVGDINYYAPETCARVNGAELSLTCQVDIFALGVLFHQYFTGQLPRYSQDKFPCPGLAVLNGETLELDPSLPEDVSKLLASMLVNEPKDRPTAWEVFCAFRPAGGAIDEPPPPPKVEPPRVIVSPGAPSAPSAPAAAPAGDFFKRGGNL